MHAKYQCLIIRISLTTRIPTYLHIFTFSTRSHHSTRTRSATRTTPSRPRLNGFSARFSHSGERRRRLLLWKSNQSKSGSSISVDATIRIVLHYAEVVHLDPPEGGVEGDQLNNPRNTSSRTPASGTILHPQASNSAQAHTWSCESNHPGPDGKDILGHRRLIRTLSPNMISSTPTVQIPLVRESPCGPIPILGVWCARKYPT